MSAPHPLQPGSRLGRFEIRALLGRGGAGAVYRAAGPDGREVAIKVHAPLSGNDAGWRWRLRREFFLLAQLRHPHIVPVLDWGEHDGLLYYAMELVEGRDAAGLAPLPADRVIEIVRSIASALGLVHNHGLLHRDIKPNNVRLPFGPDGVPDGTRALLLDFGLLVRLDEGVIDGSGTPGFIAPERLLGAPADVRSDLFALGATTFALLTGAAPSISRVDAASVALPPGLPDGVPPPLASLLGSLLAVDPRLRPRSAAEVVERLAPAGGSPTVPSSAALRSLLGSPPLVQREEALAGLRRIWASAAAGRGGPAFVVSTAGIGRSRLLRQFALELRVAGVRVGEVSGGLGPPLELVAELLRRLAADPRFGRVPSSFEHEQEPSGAALVELARDAIRAIVDAARTRPLALCIDDLDLADESSLAVIEELARAARGLPLLVVCSLRLESAGDSAVLARLRRSAVHVALLDRLDRAGVEQVVHGLFGADAATAHLVDELDHASGGSPRALLGLLEHLVDDGRAALVEGRWRLPREAADLADLRQPDDVVLDRHALGAGARRLAELLVLDRDPVELGVLARAAGLDERGFLQALEALRRGQLVRTHPGATVAIADGALASRLRAAQSAAGRRDGHAALAAALRDRHGQDDGEVGRARLELAIGRHEVALGGERELEGAGWLARGGRRLVDLGIFSEAIEPLRRAADIFDAAGGPDRHPELPRIWEPLGVASLMRDGSLSLSCFERLVAHLDRGQELSAIARAGRSFRRTFVRRLGMAGGAARTLGRRLLRGRWRDALDLAAQADRYVRALAYLGVVEAQVAFLDRARDHIDQLEAFARARGRDAEAIAIVARAHASFSLGHFDEVRSLVDAGLAVLADKPGALDPEHARRARSSLQLMRAWVEALTAGAGFGEIDLAAAAIDEMFEMHTFMLPAVHHAARGEIRLLLDTRAALFTRCFRLRSGWQEAFIYAPTAPALVDAGLVAQLRADVAMLRDLDVPPSPWRAIITRQVPAHLHLAEGDWDRAADLCREAGEVARREANGSALYAVRALAGEADAHLGAGRIAEAEARLVDVQAMAEQPATRDLPISIRARHARARAALARGDAARAVDLLAEASQALATVDLPGERAVGHLLAGEAALAAGEPQAAAGRARAAQQAFVAIGNSHQAERALRLRRRSGDAELDQCGAVGDPDVAAEGATVTMSDVAPAGDDPTEVDLQRERGGSNRA